MKNVLWICMIVGSVIGGSIPMLWGAGYLSFSSIIFSAIGGFLGIWIGYRIGTY